MKSSPYKFNQNRKLCISSSFRLLEFLKDIILERLHVHNDWIHLHFYSAFKIDQGFSLSNTLELSSCFIFTFGSSIIHHRSRDCLFLCFVLTFNFIHKCKGLFLSMITQCHPGLSFELCLNFSSTYVSQVCESLFILFLHYFSPQALFFPISVNISRKRVDFNQLG